MFIRLRDHVTDVRNARSLRKLPTAVCLYVALVCAGCATSATTKGARSSRPQTIPAEQLSSVQETLDTLVADRKFPGATLGFVLPDGRRGALVSGVSNKTTGRAMQPGDRMLLGSIGKTYVAAVLLQLVAEGRVDLDKKVSNWFGDDEWFPRLPNATDITLRQLMNHTSGIPEYIFTPGFKAAIRAQPHKVWRPEELLSFLLDAEPVFPAGQGWSYADANYILVGMIIERVTGRTFYQEVADRILKPLDLADTSPSDRPELKGLVSGYSTENNILGVPVEVAVGGRYAINPQFEWTGGGFVTTTLDLARWASRLYGGDVLDGESLRKMLDGVETAPGSNRWYGLGVMIRPSEHGQVVGHAGYMPGYVSMMAYYRDYGLAAAVQINTEIDVSLVVLETLLDEISGKLLSEFVGAAVHPVEQRAAFHEDRPTSPTSRQACQSGRVCQANVCVVQSSMCAPRQKAVQSRRVDS